MSSTPTATLDEDLDWLSIDDAYSAALEHPCTCGQGEQGEIHCPHCNRWEKARAMLKRAIKPSSADRYAPPTHEEIGRYRDTFRRELDKRMDTKHPSASPSTESHEIALRQFVEERNKSAPLTSSSITESSNPRLHGDLSDDPQWIVNDLGELGVMTRGRFFFLYKGGNIEYGSEGSSKDGVAMHDDGTPMQYRIVGKREFGETCQPLEKFRSRWPHRYQEPLVYTPGLSFGQPGDGDWRPLPAKGIASATGGDSSSHTEAR